MILIFPPKHQISLRYPGSLLPRRSLLKGDRPSDADDGLYPANKHSGGVHGHEGSSESPNLGQRTGAQSKLSAVQEAYFSAQPAHWMQKIKCLYLYPCRHESQKVEEKQQFILQDRFAPTLK